MITDGGKYKARATGTVVLGESSKKGTPFVECMFKIIGGDNDGGEVRWTSYLSEGRAAERTIEALQTCGWEGEDLGEFADGGLHGLDKNDVEIVVALEQYEVENEETGETEKRASPRVQWVNRLGGRVQVQNAMSKEKASIFGEKMRGLVLKMKQKAPPPSEAGDFNFGANATGGEQKKAAGAKKGW